MIHYVSELVLSLRYESMSWMQKEALSGLIYSLRGLGSQNMFDQSVIEVGSPGDVRYKLPQNIDIHKFTNDLGL